jgi:hypothetical protein
MARLEFYRMAEDSRKRESKGSDEYRDQTLKLSKFFADWPEQADRATDGTVIPR